MLALFDGDCHRVLFRFAKHRAFPHDERIPLLADVPADFPFPERNVLRHEPVFQLNDSVPVLFRKVCVVGNDDNQRFFGKRFQHFHHLHARTRIQRARRLVRHNDARLFYQSARDGNALALTARQLGRVARFQRFNAHVF